MFAEKLRQLRNDRKMSREALGEGLGVSHTAVYKWETGQSEPDIAKLRAMCTLFGVTMDELCDVPTENDMVVLTRAVQQLSPSERKQLISIGKALFNHAFD